MWRRVPALRTDALTSWPGCRRAAPPASRALASSSTRPLSASGSVATSISSPHDRLYSFQSVADMSSAAFLKAEARHSKILVLESSAEPSLYDLVQGTRHKGNHPDSIGRDRGQHGPRDGPADQGFEPQLGDLKTARERGFLDQLHQGFRNESRRLSLDQVQMPGHIEHRCDALVPG